MLQLNKSISILGCGWIGESLALELHLLDYSIKVSTRSSVVPDAIKRLGIDHFRIDIDNDIYHHEFFKSDILFIAIPSKNIKGFKLLLEKLENYNFETIIFVSSTSVYEFSDQKVDENSPTNNGALSQIEDLFISSKHHTILLRFAGLLGYNRKPHQWISATRKMSRPNGFVNLVHRDDCIEIIKLMLKENYSDEIFNICASSHPNRRTFYTNLAEVHQKALPIFENPVDEKFKLVDNSKVKKKLDYVFIHDDLTLLYNKDYEY